MSTVPQNVRHHSGLLADSTATRSPCPTPNCVASAADTELAVPRELGEADAAVAVDDERLSSPRAAAIWRTIPQRAGSRSL